MNEDDQLAAVREDLHDLSGEVRATGEKFDRYQEAYAADKAALERRAEAVEVRAEASKRKAKRATFAGVAGTIAAVIAIGVAVFAVAGVRKINEERAARTVTACEQSADKAQKDNAQDDVIIDLLTDISGGAENPETVAFLQPYIDRIDANKSRVRDCTPEGIASYNDSHGEQGYLP